MAGDQASWVLVCISDTHQRHRELTERLRSTHSGDILLHAGDITNFSRGSEPLKDFDQWLGELPFRHKFVIGGNHETIIVPLLANGRVLKNESVLIDDRLRLFGASWRPVNTSTWSDIPTNTHVVLTHNPPASPNGSHVDLESNLRIRLDKIQPLLSVFGHIHRDYGVWKESSGSMFANCASSPMIRTEPLNDPLCFRIAIDSHSQATIEHLQR